MSERTVVSSSVVDRLRGLGAEGLAALLRRRPDVLAGPIPAGLGELAERLGTPGSVLAALRRLDLPTLQAAEAVAALGGTARRPQLDRLLGAESDEAGASLDRVLAVLIGDVLLDPDSMALTPAVALAWPSPLGLGMSASDLYGTRNAEDLKAVARGFGAKTIGRKAEVLRQVLDAVVDLQTVRAAAERLPAEARELLARIAAGEEAHSYGWFSPRYHHTRPRTPEQHAIVSGLVIRSDWDSRLHMCAEVALALRDSYVAPFDHVAPTLPRTAADADGVEHSGQGAAAQFMRLAAALLDHCGKTNVAALKAGGVGAREVAKLVKALRCSEPELRLVLAVTHRAGLLAATGGQVAPTAEYDRWLGGDPAARLAELAKAWWTLGYVPLADSGSWSPQTDPEGTDPALRRAVLAGAVGDDPGKPAATNGGSVPAVDAARWAALVAWRYPYLAGPRETARARAAACWSEAQLLGAAADGSLSALGRALLDGTDPAQALSGMETSRTTARIQADLTAVVAGSPSAELSALLDGCADLETRGAASIWRFSPASVRRALDAGHTRESLATDLAAIADGGLPQPLDYLIGDVARRHGAVRAQTVACCLRGDDVALLAEIAAERKLRPLGLRLLAPTVLACDKPLEETLAALRAAGYAPVAEAADGTPVLQRDQPRRANKTPAPRTRAATVSRSTIPTARTAKTQQAHDPAAVATALLAAPDGTTAPDSTALSLIRGFARGLTGAEARILAHAVEHGLPVSIDYVNREGNGTSRVIENIELGGGSSLFAWCRLRQAERWFNLDRIVAVEPVSEP